MAGPLEILARLKQAYGVQQWWPVDEAYHREHGSDARFEILVGAILTQNTSWTNVEQALANLKSRNLLTPKALARATAEEVRQAIRPAGYFNQKTLYLKGLAKYLWTTYEGQLERFFRLPTPKLRELLLSFTGIGGETADDVLVYAARRPVFIVDAYTRRLTKRLGLATGEESYEKLRDLWAKRLPRDLAAHAEAHALIVEHCKQRCTAKAPACPGCPLEPVCRRVGVEPTVYLRAAESPGGAKPPR